MLSRKRIEVGTFLLRECCSNLKNYLHEDSKKRGIHLVPKNSEWGPYLMIHFRSLDKENEGKLKPDFMVSITTETGIKFCPWCGKRIQIELAKTKVFVKQMKGRS